MKLQAKEAMKAGQSTKSAAAIKDDGATTLAVSLDGKEQVATGGFS